MHLLLWIKGSLTPQEIQNKILDPNSKFKKQLIDWLESCFAEEYLNSTQEDVTAQSNSDKQSAEYQNPTETMPIPSPPFCKLSEVHETCDACIKLDT
jgi:hypothetical protein